MFGFYLVRLKKKGYYKYDLRGDDKHHRKKNENAGLNHSYFT